MSNWALFAAGLYVAVSIAIKLCMVVIVPQRRTPNSALLWLVFIFIAPILGLIGYLVFGRTKLSPYRQKIQHENDVRLKEAIRRLRLDKKLPETSFASGSESRYIARMNESLGGFPVLGGNSIELIPEYQKSVDRIIEDMRTATKHIHVEYYILADDKTAEPFIEALIQARKRGVACRVLVDYLSSFRRLKKFRKRFEAAGIQFQALLSPFGKHRSRPDLRNHRKIVVIDGLIAYTGSQNIINDTYNRKSNIKKGMSYEELVVRIRGPLVLELDSLFLTDLESETGERLQWRRSTDEVGTFERAGDTLAQIAPSGPAYSSDNNRLLFNSLIHNAERKIVITTPYFIPDTTLGDALKIAKVRGVEVVLITPSLPDAFITSRAQRSYYEEFLEAGIAIHLYDPPNFLHAKHMSIDDDIAVIGSSNMDVRSLALNAEVSLIVYDKKVVSELRKTESGYLAKSHQLHLNSWRRRPRIKKVVENVVRLLSNFV